MGIDTGVARLACADVVLCQLFACGVQVPWPAQGAYGHDLMPCIASGIMSTLDLNIFGHVVLSMISFVGLLLRKICLGGLVGRCDVWVLAEMPQEVQW